MRQTEAISASECPFRGSGRQHFSKKTHPASGKQPFHPLIHEMAHICARNKQHLATIQRPIFGKTGWRRGKTERTPVLAIGIRSVIGDLSFGRAPERGRSGMILEPDSREFFSWPGLDRGIFRCERVQPKKYLKKSDALIRNAKFHTEFSLLSFIHPHILHYRITPALFHGVSVT
jgi:hypothetical protein